MKELLIITGACGVGKSTIAKRWAKLKNGATVDCDYLTNWIYCTEFPQWTIEEERFVAKLASKIAIEYLNWGMPVSIENVWSPVGLELLESEISSQMNNMIKIKTVWLFCEIDENHKRDEQRIPAHQMKERVDVVNQELERYNWAEHLYKLDTTHLSIEQTIKKIDSL